MKRSLTKSAFVAGLECATKLYYRANRKVYPNSNADDTFLQALADGGFQVGEIAKYLFVDDPVAEDITVETLNSTKAVAETTKRLEGTQPAVIAEAAFAYEDLLVRVDIAVKNGITLDLYEVKAKSSEGEVTDMEKIRKPLGIKSEWMNYAYDIAFQKHVVSRAVKPLGLQVRAHLITVDKSKITSVDGLNQKFKVLRHPKQPKRKIVKVETGLTKAGLGDPILAVTNVDPIVERIWNEYDVPTDVEGISSFDDFVSFARETYVIGDRITTPLGKKCKNCEYYIPPPELEEGKKSGWLECWRERTKLPEGSILDHPSTELWGGAGGGQSLVQKVLDQGMYRIEDIDDSVIQPKTSKTVYPGLSPYERRVQQIQRVKENTSEPYIDAEKISKEMETWTYPLHMIDFETAAPALPFHKNRHPYEGIAFQFSHHTIQSDGSVRHAGEWISFTQGEFPNYEFVRQLKAQLEVDEGDIFRYTSHENTYLNHIIGQLEGDEDPPSDGDELVRFLKNITHTKNHKNRDLYDRCGGRDMIDLWDLVKSYYYSPHMKGSISLKQVLPAVIKDSSLLRDKYAKPIYGAKGGIPSMNFKDHAWIREELGYDPYKTLPSLFPGYTADQLDQFVEAVDEIRDGGMAMIAYGYLQYSEIMDEYREELRSGLLRYCELDTMAMVMLVEGLQDLAARR